MTSNGDLARVTRRRRLLFGLVGLFVILLTVGTSLVFAGYPGLGITLVAASPLALLAAGVLLFRG
ncbi:hypothetical protein [Halalkalicoccus sp. NIPERK01]|uniref:hypothetical protein n=1 Tax=Halalkalicoccus sp. NIPERK01 TaxID=3053469 RepID=UPI00256F4269|nr:hypothetical protein [Halalkalicoccus sp. NIPERK01]MDL5362777.1 hypothetical protein [Halalkalicoccus sp. NIPERK01]